MAESQICSQAFYAAELRSEGVRIFGVLGFLGVVAVVLTVRVFLLHTTVLNSHVGWNLTLAAARAYARSGFAVHSELLPAITQINASIARDHFTADHPGLTLLHCHQQLHMDFGFMTLNDSASAWAERAGKEVVLVRVLVGWVFLSEGIQSSGSLRILFQNLRADEEKPRRSRAGAPKSALVDLTARET